MSFRIGAPTTIPTGTATVELFNSVTTFGPKTMGNNGMKRLSFSASHDQSFTLRASHSTDGGTTWDVFYNEAKTAPAANTITGPVDFLVDTYLDVKLEAVNGGVDQTNWEPLLMGYEDRQPGA